MTLRMKFLVAAAASCLASWAAAETPAWITQSNKAAEKLMALQAKYGPEQASALGVERYDAEIFDLKPRTVERQQADFAAVAAQCEDALKSEQDP